MKTNIGKKFLSIVTECFPQGHKLKKIFNRNSLKVSYSCLPNIGTKILADTNKKYKPNLISTTPDCIQQRRNQECPIKNKVCNKGDNIYNASIICNSKTFNYIGMSAPPLRHRVATHTQSLKTPNNQTELSAKVKELNENNINHKVEFNFLETKQSYKPESKRCSLCIVESYHILYSLLENLLNFKTEVTGKCRHRSKYKIRVTK